MPATPTPRRRLAPAPLALAAVLALAACGRDDAPASDSALARDLELATQASSPELVFADTALGGPPREPVPETPPRPRPVARPRPATREREAPAPAPVRRQPAPVAAAEPEPRPAPREEPAPLPAAGPRRGSIAAGTGISVTTGDRVCTNAARPGDKIVGVVSADVVGADGAVIPAGSTAVLEVATVTKGDTPAGTTLTFRVRTLEVGGAAYSVVGEADASGGLERTRTEASKASDRKKVIGGAIAGAILGQMMGKDAKSTVIGAAAGAAAGTATAAVTAKYEGCLASGANVRVVLREPMSVAIRD